MRPQAQLLCGGIRRPTAAKVPRLKALTGEKTLTWEPSGLLTYP